MSDDITTIFVVGFPEDMKEREFQNMFTFSPGFEAATLKIPSVEEDKDSQKKQIIGFAKFRTRMEALEARDILTGRKVDAEKNCLLKAEIAKKNLHTKRGLSSMGLSTAMSATFGLDTPTTALGFQQQMLSSQTPQSQPHAQQHTPGPGGHPSISSRTNSLSNTMLASANRPEHLRISATRTFNPFNDMPLASAPILGTNSSQRPSFGSNQYSSAFSTNADSGSVTAVQQQPGTAGVMGGFMYGDQLQMGIGAGNSHSGMLLNRRGSVHGSTPVPSTLAMSSSNLAAMQGSTGAMAQPTSEPSSSDNDALQMAHHGQQQQQPPQQQQQQQSQTQQAQGQAKGLAGQRPAVLDIAALQPRFNQMNLGQLSANSLMSPMGMPYSASLNTPAGMVLPMATTRSVNSNDQNPPCNTLYVGNLPVGAKEEELRQLFQKALGYRRMSFKTKPNSGPMCFVEFESIDFATLAMSDLDGRMLSNSVGSGIRLSYSKNPLGVRSQNNPNNVALNSAAIAAAAAVSSGYHPINGSYGYPMSASIQQQTKSSSQQQSGRKISPIQQTMSALRQGATPSPPNQPLPSSRSNAAALSSGHQHSLSSSSHASPLPSPGYAKENVPKDALSFLHQPIHQLHKQANSNSADSTTPPQSGASGRAAGNSGNVALEQ
ncbi:hypothetical protein IWW36_001488 [Coemansia brasiliensis]|uniref:RRM domain-containing protein n=1 Tax=Coemansia brasiliensis TaxID=2650707 RepID=A0A9W8M1Z2_9FUNG|nr:hypothetical protein IWW36_001488 [Coemansia brasiliensis]